MTRKKKKVWIIAAIVVTFTAAAAFGVRSRINGNGDHEEGPDIPTLKSRIRDVQVVVREVGTVEPEVKVDLKSTLSGRVVDLPIRAGDRVAKGQLIARIEPDVNQAQDLLGVKNRLAEATIELEDSREEYEAAGHGGGSRGDLRCRGLRDPGGRQPPPGRQHRVADGWHRDRPSCRAG
jgi:multidrug efflux pump subunit AcrA (membrane-fusion protein)